jgi:hypothetical protein
MISTRMMSGRFAIVVVFAALASLITGVSLGQASPQPGASVPASQWLKAPGLRWQAIARAYQLRAGEAGFPTAQGLRADGLRWQAIARAYQLRAGEAGSSMAQGIQQMPTVPRQYGSRAPYAPTIGREQPLPPYYGSTSPYAAQGLRAQAVLAGASNRFDWGDAGIGVAAGIGVMLLAGVAVIGFRKQSRLAAQ